MGNNFILYLLILMSPIFFLLYIVIKEKVVYWRRMVYYFIFILGIFAYATHNIILFIGLCGGMVVIVFMDRGRGESTDFSLRAITLFTLVFLGVIIFTNEMGILKMDAGEAIVRIWPFLPLSVGLYYLISAKYDYKTGLVLIEIAGIFGILNISFFYGHQISWTVFGPLILILFWPLFFIMLSLNILVGWLRTGDKKYLSLFRNREIDGESWNHADCSLFALMSNLQLNLNKDDFKRENTDKKTVRISTAAVLGNIILKIPEDVNVITDRKAIITNNNVTEIEEEDLDSILEGDENLSELLLRNKTILGKIKVVLY